MEGQIKTFRDLIVWKKSHQLVLDVYKLTKFFPLEELKYHLLLAHDLNYINEIDYNNFTRLSDEVGKILTGWIQSQQKLLSQQRA